MSTSQQQRPRDPLLPRTWHRDLSFASDLCPGPRGVVWVSEIKGEKSQYKLVVVSEFRMFVTTGKAISVFGQHPNAHLFDLEKIEVSNGRMEFTFKKFNVIFDDAVGPSLVSTVWNALLNLSRDVPRSRLPSLLGAARQIVDEQLVHERERSPAEGFIASYRGACDQLNVKSRKSVERYADSVLAYLSSSSPTSDTLPAPPLGLVKIFDLSIACRDDSGKKFSDVDLPALSRPLSVCPHFDAISLEQKSEPTRDKVVVSTNQGPPQLSAEAVKALLGAVDAAPKIRRLLLVGVGLTASKLEKVDAPNHFKKITHLNIMENAGLGPKGMAKLLGEADFTGPEKLERFECRGCGHIRTLPLKPTWGSTLTYLDATRCDVAKSNDSLSVWLAESAKVLQVLVLASCGLNILSILGGIADNDHLTVGGVLRILDLSLNKFLSTATDADCGPCRKVVAKATHLERFYLIKCELPLPALDALFQGLNDRACSVENHPSSNNPPRILTHRESLESQSSQQSLSFFTGSLSLYLAENPMEKKHGAVFFERLSPQGPQRVCAPLRQLQLDRTYLGTVGLRDLFAALAASKAPYLKILSLRCTASKGGLFANKKKHEEMAKALADVILKCTALERLNLTGGDGSYYKADLLPMLAAIGSNKTLTILDVSHNHAGDDAILALSASLAVNQSLTKLALDGNSASHLAVKALGESLHKNHTLHSCDLPRRDTALAARNLTTDKERMDLAKSIQDMKVVLLRNRRAYEETHHKKASFSRQQNATFFSTVSGHDDPEELDDDELAAENSGNSEKSLNSPTNSKKTKQEDEDEGPLSPGLPYVDKKEEPLQQQQHPKDFFSEESEPTKKAQPEQSKKSNVAHRMKIFEEILESEMNYVRDLGVICHVFLAPIEKDEMLKREEVDKVFANVRELRQIHEELLSKLRSAARKHRDVLHAGTSTEESAAAELAQKHAQIFSEMVPFLRAYASYCATYTTAIDLVRQLSDKTTSKFAKHLSKMTKVPQCRGLDLASFLIKPPQRLCKYPLFFKDLLKHMGSSEADAKSAELISDTLKAVQGVTNTVNQTMASSGSQAKVFEIFKENFDSHESLSDLVSPTRRFLVEGDVDFATHDKAPKKHHFYLFNDLLVLATARRALVSGAEVQGKYKVKHRFFLVDLSITDAPAAISLNANDHFFQVRFEGESGTQANNSHWENWSSGGYHADFLIWCDDASDCEHLRSALEQACYDIKVLHESLDSRRRNSLSSRTASGKATTTTTTQVLRHDDSDDDDTSPTARDSSTGGPQKKNWVGSAQRPEAPPQPPPLPSKRAPPKVSRMTEL